MMTTSMLRLALLGSVSTAAAIFLLPGSAQAQATACSQAGTTITCLDGTATVLTATTTAGNATIAGPGLVTVDVTGPATTSYAATGAIATTGVTALSLTSTGGALSFTPSGTGAPVNIITTGGIGANGVTLNTVGQPATVTVGNIATSGVSSFGVLSAAGGDLALRTGNVTTTGATSDGINVTGTGAVAVTAAQVGTTGAGSRGIVAGGAGAVTVAANGVTTTGSNASGIVANSTGASVGVTLGGTNSSASLNGVNIAAATTANLALTSGTLSGANNGATIISGTGTTVTNAGTINGGNYALAITGGAATIANSGTINGRILLTANGDTVNNSGTFNANSSSDFGAGNDVFNNSGTLRVLGQSATAGTVTLTGLETFNNSGLVDLRNGHVGDVLVLPGTYAGTGAAQLGLDVNLGTSTFTGDQVRIGGAATGSTTVSITPLNTTPAVLSTSAGTVLVQAGAASTTSAFTLNGANVDQGLIQYGIVYNPSTFAYSLVATPGAGVYRTALFAQGARNLWLQSGDAWSGHMRELRDNVAANGSGGAGGRVWAQAIGQVEQRVGVRNYSFNGITTPVDMGYKQDYFGGQLGVDFGGPAGSGAFAFGVTGGYLNSNLNFANSADRINFDAVNGGVYASLNSGVFFVNLLGKYDYYWGDNRSISGRYAQKLKGSVYGGKAEAGFRVGTTLWVEPSASVSYTHSDFRDFSVASGSFAFNDQDGVRGKGGARLGYTRAIGAAKVTFYGGGNYVHEFKGQDQVSFTSGGQVVAFGDQRLRDYGEGTLGVNIGSDQGAVSGFFEGRYANGGDYEGYGGRAGMRFRF